MPPFCVSGIFFRSPYVVKTQFGIFFIVDGAFFVPRGWQPWTFPPRSPPRPPYAGNMNPAIHQTRQRGFHHLSPRKKGFQTQEERRRDAAFIWESRSRSRRTRTTCAGGCLTKRKSLAEEAIFVVSHIHIIRRYFMAHTYCKKVSMKREIKFVPLLNVDLALKNEENKAATNAEEKKQLFPRPPHYKQAKKALVVSPVVQIPLLSLSWQKRGREGSLLLLLLSPLSPSSRHSQRGRPREKKGEEKVTTFYSPKTRGGKKGKPIKDRTPPRSGLIACFLDPPTPPPRQWWGRSGGDNCRPSIPPFFFGESAVCLLVYMCVWNEEIKDTWRGGLDFLLTSWTLFFRWESTFFCHFSIFLRVENMGQWA